MVTPTVGTHFTSTTSPANQSPVLLVNRTPDTNDNFIGQKMGLPGSNPIVDCMQSEAKLPEPFLVRIYCKICID